MRNWVNGPMLKYKWKMTICRKEWIGEMPWVVGREGDVGGSPF